MKITKSNLVVFLLVIITLAVVAWRVYTVEYEGSMRLAPSGVPSVGAYDSSPIACGDTRTFKGQRFSAYDKVSWLIFLPKYGPPPGQMLNFEKLCMESGLMPPPGPISSFLALEKCRPYLNNVLPSGVSCGQMMCETSIFQCTPSVADADCEVIDFRVVFSGEIITVPIDDPDIKDNEFIKCTASGSTTVELQKKVYCAPCDAG